MGYSLYQFLFLQSTSWFFAGYLLIAQILPVFDYTVGVAMKTQEPDEWVSPLGVAFYKAFSVADTIIYLPILVLGLLLQLSQGYTSTNIHSIILLSAAYGITMYWTIDCLAVVIYANGSWNLPEQSVSDYMLVLPLIAIWGLICLIILLLGAPTTSTKTTRGSNDSTMRNTYMIPLLVCGVFSSFFYLCNDMMQSSLNPSFPVVSTSVSDLAASDVAHFLSNWLLLTSAVCLVLFGIGVAKSLDTILGGVLVAVGCCNVVTATTCRLATSISKAVADENGQETPPSEGSFGDLPRQSKCHVAVVGVAVSLMAAGLLRDILYTRRGTSCSLITTVIAGSVMFGAFATPIWPMYIGLWERLSVYSIQLWQVLLAFDRIYHHLMIPVTEYKHVTFKVADSS